MIAGEIAVDLVPQGTLIERIRAGGYGLGGVLTPTGVGTVVEEGKQQIEVDGKSYLLETALRADFALVHAFLADYLGNLAYALTARNFNPVIAMAARTVIADCRQYRARRRHCARSRRDARARRRLPRRQLRGAQWTPQTIIARRIARELRAGMLVNLGIGIPTLVANYMPAGHACLLPVGKRPDRHRAAPGGRHGASDAHRCRRPPGDGAARRMHLRQRHVLRAHSRRPSGHDRARRAAGRRGGLSPTG